MSRVIKDSLKNYWHPKLGARARKVCRFPKEVSSAIYCSVLIQSRIERLKGRSLNFEKMTGLQILISGF